jgi:hypothetical protein
MHTVTASKINIDSIEDLNLIKKLDASSFSNLVLNFSRLDHSIIDALVPVLLDKIQSTMLAPNSRAFKDIIKAIYGSGHFREPTTGELELSESQVGEMTENIILSFIEKLSINNAADLRNKIGSYNFTNSIYDYVVSNRLFYFVRNYLDREAKNSDESEVRYICHRCSYRGVLSEIELPTSKQEKEMHEQLSHQVLKEYDPSLYRAVKNKPLFYVCPNCNAMNNASLSMTATSTSPEDITNKYDTDIKDAQEADRQYSTVTSYMDMIERKDSPIKRLQKDYFQVKSNQSGNENRQQPHYIQRMQEALRTVFDTAQIIDTSLSNMTFESYLPNFLNIISEYYKYAYPTREDKKDIRLESKKSEFEFKNKKFLSHFNYLIEYLNPSNTKKLKNLYKTLENKFSSYGRYNFTPKKCPRCQVSVHPYDRVDVDYNRIDAKILRTEFLRHRLFSEEGRTQEKYVPGLFSQKLRKDTDLLESFGRLLLMYSHSGLSRLFSDNDNLLNFFRELFNAKNVSDLAQKYSHQAFNNMLADIKNADWKQRFVTSKGFMGSYNYKEQLLQFLSDKQSSLEHAISSNFLTFYFSKIKTFITSFIYEEEDRINIFNHKSDERLPALFDNLKEDIIKNLPSINQNLKEHVTRRILPAIHSLDKMRHQDKDSYIKKELSNLILVETLNIEDLPLTSKKAFGLPIFKEDLNKPQNRHLRCPNCGLIFPRFSSQYASPQSSIRNRLKYKLRTPGQEVDFIEQDEDSDSY